MTGKRTKKRSDEEILFPEVEIGGFKIKPWSFGVLFEISEMLDAIFVKLDQRNVDLKFNFDEGLASNMPKFIRIAAIAAPEVKAILAITIDVNDEVIENLDMKTGMNLLITIFKQNFETLKNVFTISSELIEPEEIKEEIKKE